jgi:ABC-2 type transport system permease protein
MPARWYVIALKHIMLKGTGFLFIWREVLVLVGMTVIFIMISVRKFKVRLE